MYIAAFVGIVLAAAAFARVLNPPVMAAMSAAAPAALRASPVLPTICMLSFPPIEGGFASFPGPRHAAAERMIGRERAITQRIRGNCEDQEREREEARSV